MVRFEKLLISYQYNVATYINYKYGKTGMQHWRAETMDF